MLPYLSLFIFWLSLTIATLTVIFDSKGFGLPTYWEARRQVWGESAWHFGGNVFDLFDLNSMRVWYIQLFAFGCKFEISGNWN